MPLCNPREVVLVVPPLLKYLAGPLLGPAMLAGVGQSVGVPVRIVDLNAWWLRRHTATSAAVDGPLGDHARPVGGFRTALSAWNRLVASALPAEQTSAPLGEDAIGALCFEHGDVLAAAARLARGAFGREVESLLAGPRPRFVGVSVMWSGQVLAGLAVSLMARRQWPGVPIVWGGAHVTALAPEIAADARYGELIDGFVAGYAEETFRRMLVGEPLVAHGVFFAGGRACPRALDDADTVPAFGSLAGYGVPRLTLPVQTSRGCAYGRCAFCTYPAIEGAYRESGLAALGQVVAQAAALDADVAIKDAFATHRRLDAIAALVDGRARFAACTRVAPRPGRVRLGAWVGAGLRTLELGVESFDAETLRRMDKRQPVAVVDDMLEDAAGLDLHLVLNVMFGFPDQSREEALAAADHVRRVLPARFPRTRFSVEANLLQVERRSLLARDPARYGIILGRAWPWSSLHDWNAPAWRAGFSLDNVRSEAA